MKPEAIFSSIEANREKDGFKRIDKTHPIDIFLGLENGDRVIMVLCPQRPPEPPSFAVISVNVGLRPDKKWALLLRLQRPDLKALFNRLIEDLDEATRNTFENPGEIVVARLNRWQRLFSSGQAHLLGDKELCGLCAELAFLQEEAIKFIGPRKAISAWKGPHDAPKDFVMDFGEIEVKAVHQQSREIFISSPDQLTAVGKPLFLWTRVVELEKSQEARPNSVAALISKLRATTETDPSATEELDHLLRLAGYEDRCEYDLLGVTFGPTACYKVTAGFPRIERHTVPAGIVNCQYRILTTALTPFKVSTWQEGTQL